MKKWFLTSVIALFVTMSSACIIVADDDDGSITVVNDSSYTIDELYVSEVDRADWGADLLGPDFLYPGDEITVYVSCDYYDVQIVDQDGYVCELYGLDLCLEDAYWYIDDAELASCAW